MKIFCLFVILLVSLCACSRNSYLSQGACYKVYKIKQNNEFYEIYAKQGRQHYKIVSQKDSTNTDGSKIKRGGCYEFVLQSHYEFFKKHFGVEMRPTHYIGAIAVSENTIIKIDGGKIQTLYYAKNLKGLYLVE